MRKGSDLIGKLVVSFDKGETLARVLDLIFDENSYSLAGILVGEGNWFQSAWIVAAENILSIGADALIIPNEKAITHARKLKPIQQILKRDISLKGTKIMTTTGSNLGNLVDLYFDDQTKQVLGYEVSGGLFADVYSGRSYVPAPKTLKIGHNFAFVPPEVAELMAEQLGGIKGSVLQASERLQDSSGLVARRLQDITQLALHKLQDTASQTNQQVQNVIHQAVTAVMNSIIDPNEQKLFMLGRTVDRDIVLPDGTILLQDSQLVTESIIERAEAQASLDKLYVAVGGSVSTELSHRIQAAVETGNIKLNEIMDQTVTAMMNSIVDPAEQKAFMIGKTIDADLLLPDGKLFVAKGAVITEALVDEAQEQMIFSQLYKSLGGSISSDLSQRVKEATTTSNQRVHDVIHQAISGLMNNLSDPAERKAFMLGKSVEQDIIAPDGSLILAKGEIVTLLVEEMAEEKEMLDSLFFSVGGSFSTEVSQRVQSTTESTNQRLKSIVHKAMRTMTLGTMAPQAQKEFMIGKSVEQDVVTPDGVVLLSAGNSVTEAIADSAEEQAILDQLYRAVGGSFVAELSQKAKIVVAKRLVNQTEGRRVRKEVRTSSGLIIAANGQIVTSDIIKTAQEKGKEEELVESTGLTAKDVIQTSGHSLLTGLSGTGDRLVESTHQVGTKTGVIFESLQAKTGELSKNTQHWLEKKKVERALGRPVTRVILDTDDRVILNLGELVTHDAITRARQADVLGILLNSIYVKQPKLTMKEQRAEVSSLSALT